MPTNHDGIAGGDLTRMAVLALLGRNGPASRATIARELEMSPATVSQVTRRLIEQRVIEPLEYEPSDGGRPGQLLGLVSTAGRAVGVKLAPDHLVFVDVRLDGRVERTHSEGFDAVSPEAVARLISTLRAFLRGGSGRLLGIGIGVPGVVERPDVGEVDAEVLGWSHMPIGRYLRDATGVPVLVENDVKALAVAERLHGRGRTRRNFVVITVDAASDSQPSSTARCSVARGAQPVRSRTSRRVSTDERASVAGPAVSRRTSGRRGSSVRHTRRGCSSANKTSTA